MLRKTALQLVFLLGCGTAARPGLGRTTVTVRPIAVRPQAIRRAGDACSDGLEDPGLPAVSSASCAWRGGSRPASLSEIRCPSDFAMLAAALPESTFANTRAMKFVIDTQDHDRLYFVNSYEFDLHYGFAAAMLGGRGTTPVGTHAEFNHREYETTHRRFLLGSIVRYGDQNVFTMELAAGDVATPEQIAHAYRVVRRGMEWPSDSIRFRAVSSDQPIAIPGRVPTIDSAALFAGVRFQPVHPGVAEGRLVRVRAEDLEDAELGPHDIVVTDRVPLELPPVAGFVTSALQTPLAHVAVLAHSRGVPDMALVGAWDDPTVRALEGRWVSLRVTRQAWTIEETERRVAPRPAAPIEVALDLGPTTLLDLASVDPSDVGSVGAKAANLGALTGLPDVPIPAGFVIPVSFYVSFMEETGLRDRAMAIANDERLRRDPEALHAALSDLRDAIERAPVDPGLVDSIQSEIGRVAPEGRVRFRSSTNAEDLPGFSGAGLYTSKTVDLSDPHKSIERGLRAVWASVWNAGAFEEREMAGISQSSIAMAVLVHRSFPDEMANGVAITRNLFTDWRPAYTVNVQAGEDSVTNPDGESTPEQFLYYTWYERGPRVEYLARSSVTDGAPVLSARELDRLGRALGAIHARFERWYGDRPGYAMDVEFKLVGPDRHLVVKQARPYVGSTCGA